MREYLAAVRAHIKKTSNKKISRDGSDIRWVAARREYEESIGYLKALISDLKEVRSRSAFGTAALDMQLRDLRARLKEVQSNWREKYTR